MPVLGQMLKGASALSLNTTGLFPILRMNTFFSDEMFTTVSGISMISGKMRIGLGARAENILFQILTYEVILFRTNLLYETSHFVELDAQSQLSCNY